MSEWRTIPSAPLYAASDDGRIKRVAGGPGARVGRILKPSMDRYGYLQVSIYDGRRQSKPRTKKVSRLICEAFHGPAPSLRHEAAHNNGDQKNNAPSNLRWATHQENMRDKDVHGTQPRGEGHHRRKLNSADVMLIRRRLSDRTGTLRSLAKIFGVSCSTIWRAGSAENWKSVC